MTTPAPKIIIEGSDDRITWKEYSFATSPETCIALCRSSRLTNPGSIGRCGFAALRNYQESPWMQSSCTAC